jgi:hypothetical protein
MNGASPCGPQHVRDWSQEKQHEVNFLKYDMKGFLEQCIERYTVLAGGLYKAGLRRAETPFVDESRDESCDKIVERGVLGDVASAILMKILYAGRMEVYDPLHPKLLLTAYPLLAMPKASGIHRKFVYIHVCVCVCQRKTNRSYGIVGGLRATDHTVSAPDLTRVSALVVAHPPSSVYHTSRIFGIHSCCKVGGPRATYPTVRVKDLTCASVWPVAHPQLSCA